MSQNPMMNANQAFLIKQEQHFQLLQNVTYSIKQEPQHLDHLPQIRQADQQASKGRNQDDGDASYCSTGGKSSSKRKTVNPMILDQGTKVTKLLQTPFKAIRIASGGAQSQGTDGELALFLAHLQTKIRDGLPQELVKQQIDSFAETNSIQADLIAEFLARTNSENRVVKNAEKLASGRKFKGVPQSQLPFAPISEKPTSSSFDEKHAKQGLFGFNAASTKREQIVNVLPLSDKTEDIFIDEDLQMTCPAGYVGLGHLAKLAQVKVETLNSEMLVDEESTRSNLASKVKPGKAVVKVKTQQDREGAGKESDSDSLFDFLETHVTENLACIPIKTNLQQTLERDDLNMPKDGVVKSLYGLGYRGQNVGIPHKLEVPHAVESSRLQQFAPVYTEEEIEDFENIEGYDFCQHPKANHFLINSVRHLVSMEDSCHLNSVTSAQQLGQMALQCLTKPGFKIERLIVLQVLIQTKNQTILKGFIRSGGLQAIYAWLEFLVDQRYEVEKAPSLLEQQILQRILIVLSKLELTIEILKEIKVGKLVNSVRLHPNADRHIKQQAETLIQQWKQLVVDYKKLQQQTLQARTVQEHYEQEMPLPPPSAPPEQPVAALVDPVKQIRRSNVLQIFNSIDPNDRKSSPVEKLLSQEDQENPQSMAEKALIGKKSKPARQQSILKKGAKTEKTEKQVSFKEIGGEAFAKFAKEANADVLLDEEDQTLNEAEDFVTQSLSQQERERLRELQNNMVPVLARNYVQDVMEQVFRAYNSATVAKQPISEVVKQLNREKFIAEIQNTAQMENPVFDIQSQVDQSLADAQFVHDLELVQAQGPQRREDKQKTDQILQKLLNILEVDPDSIVENKDVFMQILAAVDKETVIYLFKAPKIRRQTELPLPLALEVKRKLAEAVQKQIYQMIMCHYLSCNPILGNFATMEQSQTSMREKEAFYKQAKEFFFTQPYKSPTPQKQYLTQSMHEAKKLEQQFQGCSNLMQPIRTESPRDGITRLSGGANYFNQAATSMHLSSLAQHQFNNPMQIAYQQQQQYMQCAPQIPAFQDLLSQQMQRQPFSLFAQSSRPKNYRTVPCRMYHGIQGCLRGDTCHFIHDPAFQGQEIPREVLLKIRHENLQKFQTGQLSGIPVYQPGQQPHFQIPQIPMPAAPFGLTDQSTQSTMALYSQPQYHQADHTGQDLYKSASDEYSKLIKQQQWAEIQEPQQEPQPLPIVPHKQPSPLQLDNQLNQQSFAAMTSHPYFNPQFTAQYYQQQEIYKQQQQAQLMASLNNHDQAKDADSVFNLGSIGLAAPALPSQSSIDYQLKLIQDKKTQETHRKLLEQIKSDKEKKKNKYLEKYSRKLQSYQENSGLACQVELMPPLSLTSEPPMPSYNQQEAPAAVVETKQEARRGKKSRSRSRSNGSSKDASHYSSQTKRQLVRNASRERAEANAAASKNEQPGWPPSPDKSHDEREQNRQPLTWIEQEEMQRNRRSRQVNVVQVGPPGKHLHIERAQPQQDAFKRHSRDERHHSGGEEDHQYRHGSSHQKVSSSNWGSNNERSSRNSNAHEYGSPSRHRSSRDRRDTTRPSSRSSQYGNNSSSQRDGRDQRSYGDSRDYRDGSGRHYHESKYSGSYRSGGSINRPRQSSRTSSNYYN